MPTSYALLLLVINHLVQKKWVFCDIADAIVNSILEGEILCLLPSHFAEPLNSCCSSVFCYLGSWFLSVNLSTFSIYTLSTDNAALIFAHLINDAPLFIQHKNFEYLLRTRHHFRK
jgi:hypothetical protein